MFTVSILFSTDIYWYMVQWSTAVISVPFYLLLFYGCASPKVMTHHFVPLLFHSDSFYDILPRSIDMVCVHTLIV